MNFRKLADIGQHLASRERARLLREAVARDIDEVGDVVTINLDGVLSISDSFADEFFAILAVDRGEEWFRAHLDVAGASDIVRGSIVRAIRSRLDKENGQPTERGYELAPPPAVLSAP